MKRGVSTRLVALPLAVLALAALETWGEVQTRFVQEQVRPQAEVRSGGWTNGD